MATSATDAVRAYLATCTPEQADQILNQLRAKKHDAPTAPPAVTQPAMRVAKTPKATKKGPKKAKSSGEKTGPKRPLNSWMAFRKYYNASLSPLTQKAISKVLTTWWREDPFSAKWAILAKAYSVLRGSREKEEAPLDNYLDIAVPLIGIVPPEEYPQMMGWQLLPPSGGDQDMIPQVVRVFKPNLEAFDDHYTTTTLSVDDLVAHCKHAGFLKDSDDSSTNNGAQGALTMAVQPNPTVTMPTATPTGLLSPFSKDMAPKLHASLQAAQAQVQTAPMPAVAPGIAPQITMTEAGELMMPLSPFSLDMASKLEAALLSPEPTTPIEPAGKVALNKATATVATAGEYPYHNFFDPTSEFDISFNPNEETPGLEDGGMYSAFDPSANMAVEDMLNIDWNQFINDDGMA